MIEGENIIDLNAGITTLGNRDFDRSAKILSNDSEFIPICSIPRITCNHYRYHKIAIIEAFEEAGIKEEIIVFLRDNTIYPDLLAGIVLASIYRIVDNNTNVEKYYNQNHRKEAILKLFDKITKEQFYTFLAYSVLKDKKNLDIDIVDKNINNFLLDGIAGYSGNISTYDSAILAFHNNATPDGFTIFKTRNVDLKYVIGKYYIAHYNVNTGETIPLVCMVAKRKNLSYFKASQVMDDYVSTDYVELWVKDDFDITGSIHRGLRPKYRKLIKTPLQKAGVKIVTKPDFNEMLLTYSLPKFKNIKGYEEFLKKASKEALECI